MAMRAASLKFWQMTDCMRWMKELWRDYAKYGNKGFDSIPQISLEEVLTPKQRDWLNKDRTHDESFIENHGMDDRDYS